LATGGTECRAVEVWADIHAHHGQVCGNAAGPDRVSAGIVPTRFRAFCQHRLRPDSGAAAQAIASAGPISKSGKGDVIDPIVAGAGHAAAKALLGDAIFARGGQGGEGAVGVLFGCLAATTSIRSSCGRSARGSEPQRRSDVKPQGRGTHCQLPMTDDSVD